MRTRIQIVVVFTLSLVCLLVFCSCGNTKMDKPIVEQIDEQLTGAWISYDSDTVMSKWTFYEGQYVVDTYVKGEKIENSTVGTYSIGADSIHTITIDQARNVEGYIPFSFENGVLTLNGATGKLEKQP